MWLGVGQSIPLIGKKTSARRTTTRDSTRHTAPRAAHRAGAGGQDGRRPRAVPEGAVSRMRTLNPEWSFETTSNHNLSGDGCGLFSDVKV
jgi:hypothetical protein